MAIAVGDPRVQKLVARLVKVGVIPPECTKFSIVFDINSAVRIECEKFASEKEVFEVVEAIEKSPEIAAPEIAAEVTKRIAFRVQESNYGVTTEYK